MKFLHSLLVLFVVTSTTAFGQLYYTVDDKTVSQIGTGNLSSETHVPYTLYTTDISQDVYEYTENNGVLSVKVKGNYMLSDNWESIEYSFINWQGNAGFYFMYDVNGDPQPHKSAYGNVIDFTIPENRYISFDVQTDFDVQLLINLRDIVGRTSNEFPPFIKIDATPGGVNLVDNSKWQTITFAWTQDASVDSYTEVISDKWSYQYYNQSFYGYKTDSEELLLDKITGFELFLDYQGFINNDYTKNVHFRNFRLGKGEPDLSILSPISPMALSINTKSIEIDILDYYEGGTPLSYSAFLQDGTKAQVAIDGSHVTVSPTEFCESYKDTLVISVVNQKITLQQRVPIEYTITPIQAPSIGVVTVDSSGTYLMVAWERPNTQTIEKYTIYREGLSNQYTKVGEQAFEDVSVFVDNNASFKTRAYRYALTATDACGVESQKSTPHKSIHLQKKVENNQLQLSWTVYEGAEVEGYQLLEGATYTDMEVKDEFSSDQTTYTVQNPGNNLYRIATIMKESVNPKLLKAESGPFVLALSNISEANTDLSVQDIEASVRLADGWIYVTTKEALFQAQIQLVTSQGTVVFTSVVNGNEFVIPGAQLAQGVYFVTITTPINSARVSVIIK